MNTRELKARIQSIINNEDFDFRQIALRAILADLEASELRKCPKCGNEDEPLQACDHCGHTWYTTSKLDRGIERAEPPKPTGEQLKAIGKILDGDAPREYAAGDRIWTELGMSRVLAGSETGRCRWHLKDAPETPALMICNHAGECKTKCGLKIPHLEVPECRIIRKMVYSTGCPFPDAVCVPWVEPVVHTSCEGCRDDGEYKCKHWKTCFDTPLSERHNYTPKPGPAKHYDCVGCHHEHSGVVSQRCATCFDITDTNDGGWAYRRFWTAKEPEPAAPVDCENILCKDCPLPKEPKAEPGLVSFPIKEQEERWWIIYGEGRDDCCTLSEIFDGVSVHHIELKSGATVTTLQAFDDPPVRAWFRGAKGTPSQI